LKGLLNKFLIGLTERSSHVSHSRKLCVPSFLDLVSDSDQHGIARQDDVGRVRTV
jgi:hypothetical protein